mmetsp:Transcript_12847/g.22665  ORF Transcript_12847/g.22665 Transcript_12847/m.22665 type:complete len:321 (+) Transcript_12847:1045-2007(+)
MASACRTTSCTSNMMPRMFSSASTPSLAAHCRAAIHESLISFRYCTPLVASTNKLGPMVSGPNAQIFLVSSLSHPKSSTRLLVRILGSSRGPNLPSSIASARPSSKGRAVRYRRLCLLGDLDMTVWSDCSITVSRNATTGSDTLISAPPMKSFCRSCRQISKCSSPAPAIMCSPVSSITHWTMGSERAKRFRPSTSLGRSQACLGSTATRTTGDTLNFIALRGCASSLPSLVRVAVLTMNWSRPTSATVFPQGTSSTASCLRPMHSTVRCTALMNRSFFSPGTKLGPMMRTFMPAATLPENTRPNAKKRPLSDDGIILEM